MRTRVYTRILLAVVLFVALAAALLSGTGTGSAHAAGRSGPRLGRSSGSCVQTYWTGTGIYGSYTDGSWWREEVWINEMVDYWTGQYCGHIQAYGEISGLNGSVSGTSGLELCEHYTSQQCSYVIQSIYTGFFVAAGGHWYTNTASLSYAGGQCSHGVYLYANEDISGQPAASSNYGCV